MTNDPWKTSTAKVKAEISKRRNWPFPTVVGGIPGEPSVNKWKADNAKKIEELKSKPSKFQEMLDHFGEAKL